MSNTAVGFGLALIVLGVGGYLVTGMQSPTALIPALFGILLGWMGALARKPEKRKLAMHIAAGLGVIGFLATARALPKIGALLAGDPVARPAAVVSQAIMSVLMLVFVVLCVRSFINARRNRSMEGVS